MHTVDCKQKQEGRHLNNNKKTFYRILLVFIIQYDCSTESNTCYFNVTCNYGGHRHY